MNSFFIKYFLISLSIIFGNILFGQGSAKNISQVDESFVYRSFKGNLVRPSGAKGQFDPVELEDKYEYYLLYATASWCGPCQFFTPKLIDFSQAQNLSERGVQVVIVSREGMVPNGPIKLWEYMRAKQIPWPAIDFFKGYQLPIITSIQLGENGIPHLILLNRAGEVVLDTRVLNRDVFLNELSAIVNGVRR